MSNVIQFPPNIVVVTGYADDEKTIPVSYVQRVSGGYMAWAYDPEAPDGETCLGTFASVELATRVIGDWEQADWDDIYQHGSVRH